MGNPLSISIFFCHLLVFVLLQFHGLQAQQSYVNNKQLACEQNYTTALGYVCNGAASTCASYLTFRSSPPTYNSPINIGYLLGADPSDIARLNNISDVDTIPAETLIVVPVNCSCSGGQFYQHNASYVLKTTAETYFSVANNTYQGLTTCQSMIAQNPYNYRHLAVGMKLTIPLRCACPTSNQTVNGVKYLLTYLITWRDDVTSIGAAFGGVDNQSIFDANQLSPTDIIFPFTPILIPLKTEPAKIDTSNIFPPPQPPSPPELPAVTVGNNSNSSRKFVFVGVGIGAVFLLSLSGFLICFFHRRRLGGPPSRPPKMVAESADYTALPIPENNNKLSSEGVRYAIESLTVYEFEDLQKATGFFGEANRIKGSVYRGSFNGDDAAVKMMKGDVSEEIKILKQINHSHIIRLSGFCVHQGNTYLVYEYTERGALGDWLHLKKSQTYQDSSSFTSTTTTTLGWKQRVQIAYDVADALNYLHNYTNPPYIHKNLKSSNVLLDGNLRAKVANFGLARTLENQDQGGLQLTRHVVGTFGYMAPEYIENGLITPKLDVFAFGVVMLELLSGREAVRGGGDGDGDGGKNGDEEQLLYATVVRVLGGDNVREKLRGFMDPCLEHVYPLDLAYSMAQLAKNCVAHDLNSRPAMPEVFMTLSKILSSSLDWDPSDEL